MLKTAKEDQDPKIRRQINKKNMNEKHQTDERVN